MRGGLWLALLLVLPISLAGLVHAEHSAPSRHAYVTGAAFAIWCEAGGHPYLPLGHPDDYGSISGWAFSGEPECLPTDSLFGTRQNAGIGGILERPYYAELNPIGWTTPRDHRGQWATIVIQETTVDTPVAHQVRLEVEGEDIIAFEGCGNTFSLQVPMEYETHWQGGDPAFQDLWVFFRPLLVTDTFDVCTSVTGTVQVTYSGQA